MSYLLDTNVISELQRRHPHPNVLRWVARHDSSALHLSVLTLGEIRKGAELQADPERRARLQDWLENDLGTWAGHRILPVDASVADRWGRLAAHAGRTLPTIDSLIAATALRHGLTLVTRNLRDFSFPELKLLDPWTLDT